MARVGYCSECGTEVELTDDGGCPAGHAADCVTGIREGEAPGAGRSGSAPEPAAAPDESPVAAPPTVGPSAGIAPARNRGGLMFVVIAAVLILFACVATGLFLLVAKNKVGTGASATSTAVKAAHKAEVTAATTFLQGLFVGDPLAIKVFFTDDAQKALTADQWSDVASSIPTVPASFEPLTWSSDTTASFAFNVDETTGTVTAGAGSEASATVKVILRSQGSTNRAVMALKKQGTTWRVLSLMDETGDTTTYDATFVKQLYVEATAN